MLSRRSSALSAGSAISLRFFVRNDRVDTVLRFQALVLISTLLGPAVLVWVAPSQGNGAFARHWATGTVGQWMLTTAYRHGETAALAPLDFLRLLLIVGCGIVFFETVNSTTVAGAAILVAASTCTFRSNIDRRRLE
jgi:drug/metabolite transporter (DMT)-like permease